MIDLSFAIVTYNSAHQIRETVESILNAVPSGYTFSVFIVDNASTDDTLDVVKNFGAHIEVLPRTLNDGFAAGHNSILERLTSRYHFVVNPDILIENSEQILKMTHYLDQHDDVGLLVPLLLNEDRTIQYLCKKTPTVLDMMIRRISPRLFPQRQKAYVLMESGYRTVMPIEYASGSFMAFRTSVFKELKGFDARFFMYLEDADITRRANLVSKAIFFPEARVIHKWERGSYKKLKFALITLQSMWIYFNKWGWKFW